MLSQDNSKSEFLIEMWEWTNTLTDWEYRTRHVNNYERRNIREYFLFGREIQFLEISNLRETILEFISSANGKFKV